MFKYQLVTGEDFGLVAFESIVKAISKYNCPNVILPTGGTPKPLYKTMREMRSLIPAFQYVNLDQYSGIDFDDPRSYPLEIQREVLTPLNLLTNMNLVFNGRANPEEECLRMDREINKAGGIQISVIGIGRKGHIGFNEENDVFYRDTHHIFLKPETKTDNTPHCSSYGGVPDYAFTLGSNKIMEARDAFLLSNKPEITVQALHGPITPKNPASILQRHPNLTVVATHEVAQALRLAA